MTQLKIGIERSLWSDHSLSCVFRSKEWMLQGILNRISDTLSCATMPIAVFITEFYYCLLLTGNIVDSDDVMLLSLSAKVSLLRNLSSSSTVKTCVCSKLRKLSSTQAWAAKINKVMPCCIWGKALIGYPVTGYFFSFKLFVIAPQI